MSSNSLNEDALKDATPEQIYSALFAQFVTHHAQMTMMLLGKYPNPASGQIESPNLEASKHFIDQLEMIEVKTKGNLKPEESKLLKQMLSATRLMFAEVVDAQVAAESEPPPPSAPAESSAPTEPPASAEPLASTEPTPSAETAPPGTGSAAATDDESKVKFTKKY